MNPKPISETEAIRSDIEMTRRRMDDTMDALGERLHGRHIVDEIIGFFRGGEEGDGTGARVREKLSATAGSAANAVGSAANAAATAVVDTVKKNPLPILLIAGGAAWLAYSATRGPKADVEDELEDGEPYDPDTHYDRPLEYPSGAMEKMGDAVEGYTDEAQSKFDQLKDTVQDKAASAKEQVKEKLSNLSGRTKEKFQSVKEKASQIGSRVRDRASQIGDQVQERSREVYDKTRERVVRTADEHPVELGLGCLALGILVGLALPTPEPVNRLAGPTVDRLKNRTRQAGKDIVRKGRRVVDAATSAAKPEAEAQGLSLERLRHSGRAVAERAGSAATDAARAEGMTSGNACDVGAGSSQDRAGADPADPSAARPAM